MTGIRGKIGNVAREEQHLRYGGKQIGMLIDLQLELRIEQIQDATSTPSGRQLSKLATGCL